MQRMHDIRSREGNRLALLEPDPSTLPGAQGNPRDILLHHRVTVRSAGGRDVQDAGPALALENH